MADSPSISEVAEKTDLPAAESKDSGEVLGDSTDQNSGDEASQYMTGVRLYTIIGGLTMVAFLMMLDSTIVTTALPSITGTFNSVKDIGWYGSAYLICICTLQPLSGKFYQFYSSKLVFLVAVAVFELGSLLCALAKSSVMFIIGRAVAGCGGAGVLNGAFTIIAAAAPLDRRPKLIGIMLGIASIGVLAGPIIGGALTEHVTWRWCFYLNLPIGGITIFAISFIKVPDAKIRQEVGSKLSLKEKLHRLDLPGFSLFAPSIAMLLLALEWGGTEYSWNSSIIIGLFCGAGGTFLLFLACEYYRREEAMLPLSLFRNRVISCAVIASAMSQGGVYLIFYYLPTWFQVVKGLSPTSSGIHILPSVGAMSVSTALAGALVSRIGYYTPFIIVGSAGAAVAAGLMTTLRPSSGAAAWVCYQLLNGAAQGFIRQQPITAVQAVISKDQLAVAISLVTFCQMFGSSLFISFGQLAFANSLKTSLGKYAPEVDASKILNAGATNFRSLVPASSIPGIILAYNHALTTTFYIAVGTACATFVTSFGLKWINLKAKKKEDEINREAKGTNTETKKDEV